MEAIKGYDIKDIPKYVLDEFEYYVKRGFDYDDSNSIIMDCAFQEIEGRLDKCKCKKNKKEVVSNDHSKE